MNLVAGEVTRLGMVPPSHPMHMATMAESMWHSVAGVRVEELFVLKMDFAAYIGSTAPSRR